MKVFSCSMQLRYNGSTAFTTMLLCALENENKNVFYRSKIKTGGKNITVSLSTWELTSKG